MGKSTLPSNWKICATCVHWIGKQEPNVFCNQVTFEDSERARCAGGGWNNMQKGARDSCAKWCQRFK